MYSDQGKSYSSSADRLVPVDLYYVLKAINLRDKEADVRAQEWKVKASMIKKYEETGDERWLEKI
jgi:hypothetical protein